MATLKGMAGRLNRLADNLDKMVNERKQAVATAIVRQLVEATPVDTSQALSNWRVSTDGTIGAHIAAHFMGAKGSTQAASASAAIADAERAIKSSKPLDVLVIFNAVPYIRRLNEGSSAQAPAGFVEKAILIGRLTAKASKPRLG